MTICWKAVELFTFQFYTGCDCGKFVNFELGTIGRERVRTLCKSTACTGIAQKP